MKRYLTWYKIILKQLFRKADFVVPLLLIAAAVYGVSHISFSADQSAKIGFFAAASEESAENSRGVSSSSLAERLLQEEGALSFVPFDSEDALKRAVQDGSVRCGFVLPPVMEDAPAQITLLLTEASGESSLAKETVYMDYLDLLSKDTLYDIARNEEFYVPGNEEERYEYIKERYAFHRGSDDVFHLIYETVDSRKAAASEDSFLFPGMVGLFILIVMMLNAQALFSEERVELNKKITVQNKIGFQILELQAAGIPLSVAAAILWMIERNGSFSSLLLGFAVSFLYSVFCALWIFLYLQFFRNSLQYNSVLPITLLFNLLICPVVFDASTFFPALKYVQYLFPVTWYCRLAALI